MISYFDRKWISRFLHLRFRNLTNRFSGKVTKWFGWKCMEKKEWTNGGNVWKIMFDDGQIISTSAEVTPNRGLARKSPLIQVWELQSFAQNVASNPDVWNHFPTLPHHAPSMLLRILAYIQNTWENHLQDGDAAFKQSNYGVPWTPRKQRSAIGDRSVMCLDFCWHGGGWTLVPVVVM